MEQIIVLSFLVALNVAAAIINYYFENYKVSNFNSFAAGICYRLVFLSFRFINLKIK